MVGDQEATRVHGSEKALTARDDHLQGMHSRRLNSAAFAGKKHNPSLSLDE